MRLEKDFGIDRTELNRYGQLAKSYSIDGGRRRLRFNLTWSHYRKLMTIKNNTRPGYTCEPFHRSPKIKMTLRPLPSLISRSKAARSVFPQEGAADPSFGGDERQKWLPEDDPYQTFLEDEFDFEIALAAKGQKRLIL